MPHNLSLNENTDAVQLSIGPGEVLFVLGANGSGKSALMQHWFRQHMHVATRISAQRQNWLHTNSVEMTAAARHAESSSLRHREADPAARWVDQSAALKINVAIFDVIDAENVRARAIADAMTAGETGCAEALLSKRPPRALLNDLLRLSNLPIELSIAQHDRILATRNGSEAYSIAQLSDGERNALLIGINVLTAPHEGLILIDEPERHLHRSILVPLVINLLALRPDCAFVVSTHELQLPAAHPNSRTLLVRSVTFGPNLLGHTWEADLVPSLDGVDDDLRTEIVGARRRVIFVEGHSRRSLDQPLYSLIFPNASVIPKMSCRDVEHAVSGVRGASALHWIRAFGIVDNDARSADEIARLREQGIYALDVFSVESIYYHPFLQGRAAARGAAVTGADATDLVSRAGRAALDAIREQAAHLSRRIAEKDVRAQIFAHLPTADDMATGAAISVTIDVELAIARERQRLDILLQSSNLQEIIGRFPVRETRALDLIANHLGFQNRRQYEAAIRQLLLDDNEALEFARTLFGRLWADLQ